MRGSGLSPISSGFVQHDVVFNSHRSATDYVDFLVNPGALQECLQGRDTTGIRESRFNAITGRVKLSAIQRLGHPPIALRKFVEKHVDRSDAAVPGDDKIGSRVRRRFAGSARYPSNPSGIT